MKYVGAAAAPVVATSGAAAATASAGKSSSALFEPVKIGSLDLKNRLIRSATSEIRSDSNGSPTPDLVRVYEELAAGGVSMITTGITYVLREDQYAENASGFYADSQIEHYKAEVHAAHDRGAKISMQLAIIGTKTGYKPAERAQYSPVALKDPTSGVIASRGMTREEIKHCVDGFASAAARAKRCGFDAVELHFAHNYLVSKFLVPYFNTRTDEYGGNIEKRARFAFEIVEAVRTAVGPDFPVLVKMEGNDYLGREGNTAGEIAYVAGGLAQRGVSALTISGGNTVTKYGPGISDIMYEEDQSYFARDARRISEKVNIPIVLTGGNRSVAVLENALQHNDRLVAFGLARTLLAEPDLPRKWQQDATYTPKCISCNWCFANYSKQKTQCQFRRDSTA